MNSSMSQSATRINVPLPSQPSFPIQYLSSLNIGSYQVIPIRSGIFGLDGGAMFGTVPKTLWEKKLPSDPLNRIPMQARALLLKGEKEVILVDTGNGGDFVEKYGPKLGQKFAQIYAIHEQNQLIQALSQHHVNPEDVTHVILTHLHFDHAGGATRFDPVVNKVVPTFPKAKYFVQRENFLTAQQPNIRERASYLAANWEPLLAHEQLVLLDGPQENFLPHLSLLLSQGHTQGQQHVLVHDNNQGLFYGADLIPTHAHVRKAWIMGYDLHPLLIIEEKTSILKKLARNHWYLFFEHDPYFDLALIQEGSDDFDISQAIVIGETQ
ncbi:MAG: MBL fold metallo-hydrolase [Bdellovibrionaceae bacterium]|nr:MBL fold metallo-hydrolase [Pseudobdellovibrionaceae bacterium]MDW8189910.1 MBL fold metallo-hydrolase [Pseudobdellovibrionaceae bacterium]